MNKRPLVLIDGQVAELPDTDTMAGSSIEVDTTTFSKNLSGVTPTVQGALERVDSLQLGGGVVTPTNVLPTNLSVGVTLTPTLQATPFQAAGSEVQASARFQIFADGDLATPIWDQVYNNQVYMVTVPSGAIQPAITYWWRVQYTSNTGSESAWSVMTRFTTGSIVYVATPGNSIPSNGAADQPQTPMLISSSFSVQGGTDTHLMSQWHIRDSVGQVWDSGWTPTNLTSVTVPLSALLQPGTQYWWCVRHYGQNVGWSSWSVETSFTTQAQFNTGAVLHTAYLTAPYFTSYLQDGDSLSSTLAQPVTIPSTYGYAIAVSPNKKYIAIAQGVNTVSILLYARVGLNIQYLTSYVVPQASYRGVLDMQWDPSGTYLAALLYATSSTTMTTELVLQYDGATLTACMRNLYTNTTTYSNGGVTWNPSGTGVLFHHEVLHYYGMLSPGQFQLNTTATFDVAPSPPYGSSSYIVGKGAAFSPDGTYLALQGAASPYIQLYRVNGNNFVRLSNSNVGVTPLKQILCLAWSNDSQTLYLGSIYGVQSGRTGIVLKRYLDTFTYLPDAVFGATVSAFFSTIAVSSDNTYIAMGLSVSPYFVLYKRVGDTFTKLTTPTWSDKVTSVAYG